MNTTKFDKNYFSTIPTYEDKIIYCKETLSKFLGEGISRKVWELDNNTIIKVAKNDIGLIQNQAETDIYEKYKHYNILRKIIETDKFNNHFLICEKCDLISFKRFQEITQIPYKDFTKLIVGFENTYLSNPTIRKNISEEEINFITIKFPEITNFLKELQPPNVREMIHLCNLGVKNNQIILMDYGYNKQVMDIVRNKNFHHYRINNKHRHN